MEGQDGPFRRGVWNKFPGTLRFSITEFQITTCRVIPYDGAVVTEGNAERQAADCPEWFPEEHVRVGAEYVSCKKTGCGKRTSGRRARGMVMSW